MPDLRKTTARTFGAIHVFMGIFGLWLAVGEARGFLEAHSGHPLRPYQGPVYWAMTTINVVCLAALISAGVLLLRADRRGLRLSNYLFGFELIYLLGSSALGFVFSLAGGRVEALGDEMGANGGIGDMGISPQLVTAYPVIALIALNLAFRGTPPPARP